MENKFDKSVYNSSNDTQTLGNLVAELQKIDENTPVKLLCDHTATAIQLKGEDNVIHSIHLEVDFTYLTELVKKRNQKEARNNGRKTKQSVLVKTRKANRK